MIEKINKIDLQTAAEKEREKNHAEVRRLYRLISTKAARKGISYKPARLYGAVAQKTREIGMRGGAGYTAQSVMNIVKQK